MAGDWIKMRANLHTHPKVVRMASALKADRLRVVGGLHAVWVLFDAHSVDGVMDGYTLEALDQAIGWTGFTDAMALPEVGWLVIDKSSLSAPRFHEHMSRSAKRRATETDRKRVTRSARIVSAIDADENGTREEKRREEKKSSSTGASRFALTELPAGWLDYCKLERPDLLPQVVFRDFSDYWSAKGGAAARKVDWFATWRMWVRKERVQCPQQKGGDWLERMV